MGDETLTPEQKAIRSSFEAIRALRQAVDLLADHANIGHSARRQIDEKLHEVDAIVSAPVSRVRSKN